MSVTTENPSINGVDVATLFATLDAVKDQNEIAEVPVPRHQHVGQTERTAGRRTPASSARCRRCSTRTRPRSSPTTRPCSSARTTARRPVEYLLHAIAACLTSGIANIASARGVKLNSVSSTVEGDINLLGILGLSRRLGAQRLRADQGHLPHRRGRGRRDGARPGRAVAQALCRVRRPHQPHAGRHRRGHALNPHPPKRTSDRPCPACTTVDTVVIGAGHAGLAVSRLLTDAGRDHVVLDRGRVGERWRTRALGLPPPADAELDDAAARLELRGTRPRRVPRGRCVRRPPRGATPPRSVPPSSAARRWSRSASRVAAAAGTPSRRTVGPGRRTTSSSRPDPHGMPQVPAGLARDDVLTSSDYRNPDQLPDGGVLVVGASSSGRADRRRAQPGRSRGRPRRRSAHPDAAPLPRPGHLLVAGDHRSAGPHHRRDARPRRRPAGAVAAAGRGHRRRTVRARPRPRRCSSHVECGWPDASRGCPVGWPSSATTSPTNVAGAEQTMHRFLDAGRRASSSAPGSPTRCGRGLADAGATWLRQPTRLDLRAEGIGSVVVAAGFRPHHPWLRLPITDPDGEHPPVPRRHRCPRRLHRRPALPAPSRLAA